MTDKQYYILLAAYAAVTAGWMIYRAGVRAGALSSDELHHAWRTDERLRDLEQRGALGAAEAQ